MSEDRKDRFRRIYEEHSGSVYGYALRRVSRRDEAKDVTAEAFLVAWRRLDDVPDHPLPWLLGTARRVLANQRRAAGNQEHLFQKLMGQSDAGSDAGANGEVDAAFADVDYSEASGDDQARRVREAMSRLPDAYREALTLVYWDGLSTSEAAQTMGCARAAMLVRLHRARKMLSRELAASPDAAATGAAAEVGE